MAIAEPPSEPASALAVGHPARPAMGRVLVRVLLAGVVFSVLTGPVKQIAVLYDHAPWLNDPYDAVVSFAMFLVPFVTLCAMSRVLLCRRAEPLPVARVRDLLRACRVVLALMVTTLLTEWASVALGANRRSWDWAQWHR